MSARQEKNLQLPLFRGLHVSQAGAFALQLVLHLSGGDSVGGLAAAGGQLDEVLYAFVSLPCCCGLLAVEVALEELPDAQDAIEALLRVARAGEVVPGVGVADVFDGAV